jgi:hypothetical protein
MRLNNFLLITDSILSQGSLDLLGGLKLRSAAGRRTVAGMEMWELTTSMPLRSAYLMAEEVNDEDGEARDQPVIRPMPPRAAPITHLFAAGPAAADVWLEYGHLACLLVSSRGPPLEA